MVVYLRLTYSLQIIAALNLLLTIFLPWHTHTRSAASLLYQIINRADGPLGIWGLISPWWLLVFLVVAGLAGLFRGLMGVVERRRVGLLAAAHLLAGLALLSLLWFYAAAGEWRARFGTEAHLQIGFWLAVTSTSLLALLLWIETSLPADQRPARIPCPNCGQLNHRQARRCAHCGLLILPGERW